MAFHGPALDWYAGLPPSGQLAVRLLLALLVGWLALRLVRSRLDAVLRRAPRLDATVRIFLVRVAYGAGWVLLAAALLRMAGVDLTALLGGLAIGGFVLGFALKDTLGNLAAGVLLLANRPFNVDDVVTVEGHSGTVVELGLALTVLQRFDGTLVTIPNGQVLSGPVVNFTRNPLRRAEARLGIAYGDDVDKAVRAILRALDGEPAVLKTPAPEVVVVNLADSAVELEVRAWAKTPDFGKVINALRPLAKRAVEEAGCSIPFPQREVLVRQAPAE